MNTETMSLDEFHTLKDKKRTKHGNQKTIVDGLEFASKAESIFYQELLILLAAGEIYDLELQPRILLIDAFKDCQGHKVRPTYYIADFRYKTLSPQSGEPGQVVVVDVKPLVKGQKPGKRKYTGLTETFRIKWKLAEVRYGHLWEFRIERR